MMTFKSGSLWLILTDDIFETWNNAKYTANGSDTCYGYLQKNDIFFVITSIEVDANELSLFIVSRQGFSWIDMPIVNKCFIAEI